MFIYAASADVGTHYAKYKTQANITSEKFGIVVFLLYLRNNKPKSPSHAYIIIIYIEKNGKSKQPAPDAD